MARLGNGRRRGRARRVRPRRRRRQPADHELAAKRRLPRRRRPLPPPRGMGAGGAGDVARARPRDRLLVAGKHDVPPLDRAPDADPVPVDQRRLLARVLSRLLRGDRARRAPPRREPAHRALARRRSRRTRARGAHVRGGSPGRVEGPRRAAGDGRDPARVPARRHRPARAARRRLRALRAARRPTLGDDGERDAAPVRRRQHLSRPGRDRELPRRRAGRGAVADRAAPSRPRGLAARGRGGDVVG